MTQSFYKTKTIPGVAALDEWTNLNQEEATTFGEANKEVDLPPRSKPPSISSLVLEQGDQIHL